MNILELAILKKMVGGGGGSGTDNYNDLSNLPQINGETLAGDKSSSSLGLQSEIKEGSELASDLVDDTNQDNKFVTSAEKLEWSGKQNLIDSSHKLSSDLVDDADKTNKFVTASEKETWNGKQNLIDNSHKLSSDLVDDTNQDNKFVTSAEKLEWSGKQNLIDSSHKLSSDLVDDADKTNKFVTASEKETWNGKQNLIDNSHKLSSDLVDDTNKTNKFVTSTEKNTWNAKQNALTFDDAPTSGSNNPVKSGGIYTALSGKQGTIDSSHKLSSALVSFSTAQSAALASGINSTKVGQISTNQTNILSVEDMVCATEFSSSTAYEVGDMVTYEHKLYKFINAHQGAWSASDVQNYDLTSDMSLVRPMNPYGQAIVSSGSLDNINQTETRVYNNPSGLPTGTSGFVICETTVVDRNTATQTITFITGNSTSIFGQSYPKFFRSKVSGTWRDWMIVDTNGRYSLVRTTSDITSATVDISSISDGTYLLRCANSESVTIRYGVSLYTLLLNTTGTTMVFNPIVEVTNAKISNLTRTDNTLNFTFDHRGYHNVVLTAI